ncbi:hypothetical protein [Rheinheimera oceanensis]|uniref:hypothetical protein n=1 Tax=Rheinheimera oceanensis TaxID=2817449 RepID=UPI001BFD5619|nr:hypothetical protein [Rheinheimera oceanensis]
MLSLHVTLSLVGIFAGFFMVLTMLSAKQAKHLTVIFLFSTLASALTGFILPADRVLPSHIIGGITTISLLISIFSWYVKGRYGVWRIVYAVTALSGFYFNAFVGVVQAFLKVPVLHAVAPTQSAPVLIITQSALLVMFIIVGFALIRKLDFVR